MLTVVEPNLSDTGTPSHRETYFGLLAQRTEARAALRLVLEARPRLNLNYRDLLRMLLSRSLPARAVITVSPSALELPRLARSSGAVTVSATAYVKVRR